MEAIPLFGRSVFLSAVLSRQCNNFDLFRLIAAMTVIYGHSFVLAPALGFNDILFELTGQHAAAMAVKFFFFLSGLLVTDSLITRKSASQFLIARFFRIWPALAFVLLGCVFIIGPISTELDLTAYFRNPNTYLYFKHQILMQTWGTQSLGYYDLPGVFVNNNYKNTVNAPLWSLVVEVVAYIVLAAVFLIGLLERRLATLLIALIVIDSIIPTRIIFTFLPKGNEDFSVLPFCFAVGAFFAVHKDLVKVSVKMPLGFILLAYVFRSSVGGTHFFYLSIFTMALYVSTSPWVVRYAKLPFDVSYGTYLWGFPIQQLLSKYFPNINGISHVVIAIILSIAIGAVSWVLVERRFISIGSRVGQALLRVKFGI